VIRDVLQFLPTGVALFLVILILAVAKRALGRTKDPSRRFWNQWILFGLGVGGFFTVILALPLGPQNRGAILSFLGIVLSAAIALSSTTFLGNILAGLMLRAVRNFRTGDFVRCGDHFGRVSQRGLFHTEIQTEYRELVTLPNLYLVTHPTTTVRSSGTVVAASVSLGYDVPHGEVESLSLKAVEAAELRDGFVLVEELGDFSVRYRVSGILEEVKHLVTAQSRLRTALLDALHEGGIEIVSPGFMNQRPLPDGKRFIPSRTKPRAGTLAGEPERLIFDKADEAASVESLHQELEKVGESIRSLEDAASKGTEAEKAEAEQALEGARKRKARLEAILEAREEKRSED
jgi:small-conductance mechanosensitive channel